MRFVVEITNILLHCQMSIQVVGPALVNLSQDRNYGDAVAAHVAEPLCIYQQGLWDIRNAITPSWCRWSYQKNTEYNNHKILYKSL